MRGLRITIDATGRMILWDPEPEGRFAGLWRRWLRRPPADDPASWIPREVLAENWPGAFLRLADLIRDSRNTPCMFSRDVLSDHGNVTGYYTFRERAFSRVMRGRGRGPCNPGGGNAA